MLEFIEKILDNLQANGFPDKVVSLPTEKMYEAADKRGLSFNKVIEEMRSSMEVKITITDDKVYFDAKDETKIDKPTADNTNTGASDPLSSLLGNVDKDQLFKQAGEMLKNMDPEQIKQMQDMFLNMSDEEKEELMKKGKDMGLI